MVGVGGNLAHPTVTYAVLEQGDGIGGGSNRVQVVDAEPLPSGRPAAATAATTHR